MPLKKKKKRPNIKWLIPSPSSYFLLSSLLSVFSSFLSSVLLSFLPSFLLLFLPFFSSCFVHSQILVWEIHCSFPSFTAQLISSCMLPLCPARAVTTVYVPFLDPMGLWTILCLSLILFCLVGSLSAVRWVSQTLMSAGYMLLLLLLSRFSRVRLCDLIDGSPPGSPVPGILQARTLEWVAISFSNAWKWKVKVKLLSRVRLLATPWTAAYQAPLSMGFCRQEYWSGGPLPSPGYMLDLLNLPIEYIGWKSNREDWEIKDISPSFSFSDCSPVGALFPLWLQLSHLDDLWPLFISVSWFWPFCFAVIEWLPVVNLSFSYLFFFCVSPLLLPL